MHTFDSRTGEETHRVGPFEARVPKSALDDWRVVTETGVSFPVIGPRFQVASYHIRRLRGVHQKDYQNDKLARLEEKARSVPGLYGEEADTQYADLDRLAGDIMDFQAMPLLAVVRTYGLKALASKLGTGFFTSRRVTQYYQRAEGRKADELLLQLQSEDSYNGVEFATY
jgi:hypothetical protein